jgi:hypothetical protein
VDINRVLANMEDDDPVPQSPSASGSVRLDDFFENVDHRIPDENDADTVIMKLPMGRLAKTTRTRMRSCTTPAQLRQLDRELYVLAGLNPADYGI